MNGRLQNLEIALGTVHSNEDVDDVKVDETLGGVLERVSKLETLSRLTLARTCDQLRQLGVTSSGQYWIDPDGVGLGLAPVQVWCDMRTGATRVTHDLMEDTVTVTKCREPGCSVHSVNYDIPMKQVEALILLSGSEDDSQMSFYLCL